MYMLVNAAVKMHVAEAANFELRLENGKLIKCLEVYIGIFDRQWLITCSI